MDSFRFFALTALVAAFGIAAPLQAQVPPNCEVTTAADPDRQVLSCAFGVVIEMEAAAQMGFSDAASDGAPDVIDLQGGAALIEVEPGTARPQIRTPHAIAAVRGTVYVVDVTADGTAVFVVEGEVAVMPTDAQGAPAVLSAGDGIDVTSDGSSDVQQWPAARVAALLARFGR